MNKDKLKIFKVKDIASWWLKDVESGSVSVALPALQRGFVWKPAQTERLWDSIAQGFPIGSLLLSDTASKIKDVAVGGRDVASPDYYLLDGQQRATSICMGFKDVWSVEDKQDEQALWVDIAKPKNSDRRFIFRLVTKSHPWGYQKNDPTKRLSTTEASKATEAFNALYGENKKPHDFLIAEVFPWDAKHPVPLALLLQAIDEKAEPEEVWAHFKEKLYSTKIGKAIQNSQQDSVKERFNFLKDEKPSESFKHLIESLRCMLGDFHIPAPILDVRHSESDSGSDEYDPTFNLFKRVNAGGTALNNEEIQYSLLKSIWQDAPDIIEKDMLADRKIMTPARLVSLMARLYLMSKEGGWQDKLTISQFKKQVLSEQHNFESFCKEKGKPMLHWVYSFLTGEADSDSFLTRDDKLPTILAASISQSQEDVMLLVMYWRLNSDKDLATQEAMALGFITAMAWFSKDTTKACKALIKLWDEGNDYSFSPKLFQKLRQGWDGKGRCIMPPIPSPIQVKQCFDSVQEGELKDSFEKHYYRSDALNGILPKDYLDGDETKRLDIAYAVLHQIYNDDGWRFLLYAQREYVQKWYGWFDPTQPQAITDRNRPWDYDHILPDNWSNNQGKTDKENDIQDFVKAWVSSIGNFRVWPMGANRSKGDGEILEESLDTYDLNSLEDVCKASFIDVSQGDTWVSLAVNKDHFRKDKEVQIKFIRLAKERTVAIYREWYDTLCIGDLMAENEDLS